MQRIPTLIGINGHFTGEIFPLQYGKTITIGRSRTADFSLRRTTKYRSQSANDRSEDASAKTVSAKHFQITMFNLRSIEIRNLSPNGTHLDGKLIEKAILNDAAAQTHEIRFGQDEAFKLEMRLHEETT